MSAFKASALMILTFAALIACGGEEPVEERPAIQQASGEEPKPAPPQNDMEMAAGAYMLEIVNPMPHDMVVSIATPDGTIELGTVPAQGSAEFAITTPPAMQVSLEATDVDATHTERGRVDLSASETASWTIGAGAGAG